MANDDYDEVDETADPVDDEVEDDAEEGSEEEQSAESAGGGGGSDAPAPRTDADDAETLTVSSKEALRREDPGQRGVRPCIVWRELRPRCSQ